jgi:MFS family permease
MLMAAALLYLMATIIRVSMAREASKGMETSRSQLSFSSLKTNLGAMVGLTLAGGLFTWILLTDGVRDIFFRMSFSFLSVYMQDIAGLTITEIGLMSSIFGVAMMAVMIPAGWLADKFGERLNIAISFLLMSISIGMIATVPPSSPPWVYGVGWIIAGIGVGLATPAYQSLISKAVPQRLRGVAYGLFSTSLGLVSLPAPMIGGYLWEKIGPQFPFMLTALISLLSIVPAWLKFKVSGDVNETPPADDQPAAPVSE